MAKPKSSRRHKPKTQAVHRHSKPHSPSRAKPIFVGVALFCAAITLAFLIARRPPNPSPDPGTAAAPTGHEVEPIKLAGLTIEQQVTALREATTKLAEALVARFPQEATADVLLGDVHRRFGRSAEAVACWRHALEMDPHRISAYDRIAIVDMERGQFEEALLLWRRVLALDSASPSIHGKLGRALMALGRQDEAIAALKKEVEISPRSAPTFYLLGQAYHQKDSFEEAIGYYEKAMTVEPNSPAVCYGLATAYARLNDPEKARQYREKFRALSAQQREDRPYGFSPEDDLVKAREDFVDHAMRGATLEQAKGRIPSAAALLHQAAAVDPNHIACRKKLAALYQSTGKLPEALRQCEQVARLQPTDPTCQLLIGTLALQLKQPGKAESAFKKLIELAPRESVGYRELARLCLGSDKRLNEARRLAERAVELAPVAPNYSVAGQVYSRAGDR